jgi:hypothetical protein
MNAMTTPIGPAELPVAVLAQLGGAMASTVAQVQAHWPGAPPAAALALGQLEELGLQVQEVVRMLAAPAGAMPERVDLGVAALQARAEWAAALQRAGATWSGPERGCEVLTDPAVLKQLLDLAIGHALFLGASITLEVSTPAELPLAVIRIEVARSGATLFAARPGDAGELNWALLLALARHAGVHVERQEKALSVELLLGWPPVGDGARDSPAPTPTPPPALVQAGSGPA